MQPEIGPGQLSDFEIFGAGIDPQKKEGAMLRPLLACDQPKKCVMFPVRPP